MEENVQRVFSILIAVMIFFLLPMYIAFEKKDDISYSLALKITTNFVDTVSQKGYMSRKMYDDFVSDLSATDNIYDITVEHVAKKYYPVIYVYEDNEHKKFVNKFDYIFNGKAYEDTMYNEGKFKIGAKEYDKDKLVLNYELIEERYNFEQIARLLEEGNGGGIYSKMKPEDYKKLSETEIPAYPNMYEGLKDGSDTAPPIYTLNEGDTFTITIRNKNISIATILFNSMTMGMGVDNTTKVYINYGATVKNEEYKLNNSINGALKPSEAK